MMEWSEDQQFKVSERYSHLLQPVRDLTKNWSVDLADELQTYLNELSGIEQQYAERNGMNINFGEAALLIQSSAGIYSKKVDFLHNLVFQTVANVKNHRTHKSASGNDNSEASIENFNSLDDLPIGRGIQLKEKANSKLNLLPLTPLSLIKLSDKEKGEGALISRQGEVLGHLKDFKMNTCLIHKSGTMVLDRNCLKLLQENSVDCKSPESRSPSSPVSDDDLGVDMNHDSVSEQQLIVNDQQLVINDDTHDENNCNDDTESIIAPFGDIPEDDLEKNSASAQNKENITILEEKIRRQSIAHMKDVGAPVKMESEEPWTLDPYECITNINAKSFTCNRPKRVPSRSMIIKQELPPETQLKTKAMRQMTLNEFLRKTISCTSSKLPSDPLKRPHASSLDDIYEKVYHVRRGSRKSHSKLTKRAKKSSDHSLVQPPTPLMMDVDERRKSLLNPQDRLGDSDDGFGDDQLFLHYEDDDDCTRNADNERVNIDERDIDRNTSRLEYNVSQDQWDFDEPPTQMEVHMKRVVQQYNLSARRHAVETDLSKKVNEWEARIRPKLALEERHRCFDIKQCGSSLVGSIGQEGTEKTLANLSAGMQPFEICRLLLSSLQLANTYNVQLETEGQAVNSMKIKLLKRS